MQRLKTILLGMWLLALGAAGPARGPALAQEQELPLPADLFVLTESNQVMHISRGSSFAAAITPPEQGVVDFGVAPDGQWIAYRTATGEDGATRPFLAVTAVDGLSGQVVEFEEADQPPITGRGRTLAWSPDGTAIAYTTGAGLRLYLAGVGEEGAAVFQDLAGGPFLNLLWSPGGGYLAAEAEGNVWSVYRRETARMTFAGQVPASAGAAWVREGVLALAPPAGGLIALSVADGSQTVLLGAEVVASQPTRITGGRLIFLVHGSSGQRFAARRFGTVDLQSGEYQEFEALLELTAAMRWLPNGAALLATIDGTLTVIEPRTDARRELMTGVKFYDWGPLPPQEAAGVALPADLYFLCRDEAGVAQLWRLPADGGPAEQVTAEASNVVDYSLSPDGSQIAYTAGGSLVVAGADGTGSRELSPVAERPGAGGQPDWSPDGRMIAFVRDGIWLIPATGGARTELVADRLGEDTPPDQVRVYLRPRWNPSGSLLLVEIGYYEGSGLGILPITGGEALELPTGASQGTWLPNGLVLAWDYGRAYATPGLYLVDPVNIGAVVTVLDEAWHIRDAAPLANEAAMVLRDTGGGDFLGPRVVQPFLVPLLPEALPIPHGQGGLLEAPVLSPEGRYAAGLRQAGQGDFGLAGRLAIVHLETGERFAVETPGEVWGLQWGERHDG